MYTIQSGNTIITGGTVAMEPNESSYVKQCFIRTPYIFSSRPVITVTVYTSSGNSAFVLYGLEESIATGETIFKVSATNNDIGIESTDEYWCDFTMMGELAETK